MRGPGRYIGRSSAARVLARRRTLHVGSTDIGGVVTSSKGPEAGVWVIAETTELPTKFVKIVVTDDQGRYLVPDLPKANYDVWVRGYGLVDSPKSKATPGMTTNLKAVPAPDKKAAIEYYPALYWFSLLQNPAQERLPRHRGRVATASSSSIKSQGQWIREIVEQRTAAPAAIRWVTKRCTREIPDSIMHHAKDSKAAWVRRIQIRPGRPTDGFALQPRSALIAPRRCTRTGATGSPRRGAAGCRSVA